MWRRNFVYLQKNVSNIFSASKISNSRCNCVHKLITVGYYHSFKRPQNITSKANFQYLHDVKLVDNVDTDSNTFTYRTHTCGELRSKHSGQKVTLCGWVQFQRLSKFLLLRDAYGLTQCIVSEGQDLPDIPLETVVRIKGTVVQRPKNMINPTMSTGEVEVIIKDCKILNNVNKLPFNLRDYQKPKEQLRLQYRYVDLRFPEMQSNLRFRSNMLHNMRKFLIEKYGFVEVETPTLFCRTPGGAREFVVPTHHKDLFYSLVQSPQQFKQMLMAGGVDRYFQVARCYRDETTRPDRQPEFTQLDIELSFTNLDGVLTLIEQLLYETYLQNLPKPPFERLTYKEAMESYGTDKPDLTYDLVFKNLTTLFKQKSKDLNFGAYALPYPSELGKLTAKSKEKIRELVKKYKNKVILHENIPKELGEDLAERIKHEIGSNSCIISMGESGNSCSCLGEIRELIASLLKSKNLLVTNEVIKPLWVVDFPLFVKGENGLETCHHPFTAPHPDDLDLLHTEPEKVRSLAYDLVINGNEVGGGSVRVHNAVLQEELLKILNIDSEKLSHFMDALKSGCPPHAGIALGIDRLVSLACNAESIRDVIAFPKSHDGKDPLSGAPNTISLDDKKYYHIV
ncbi:aspartate--tRNA ligase, mitochondrial [Amyelois transitella]|uniref:aspartate--tRNA ligase, mitochondrial n=1 Tax=Amyelois transitella TaxID=680683 RepID=UPI00298F6942|nr:aspartate--tRNA ligase, mitochondrial [Amyelois transitella]